MIKTTIKKGQIWISKSRSDFQLLVQRQKGGKWQCKVLTEKPGVYNGTHTMSNQTIWIRFTLHV